MRAATLVAALLLAGCPSGLEEQQHVSKLRVLGVRADPPELILQQNAPLPSTRLTAFAVDPSGAATVRFALCADLTGAPSATLPCPGTAGLELASTGPVSAHLDLADPRILAFAAGFDAGSGSADLATALDKGVPLLIGFTAASGAQTLSGFQTVTLRSAAKGPADVNPELTDLQLDGDPRTRAKIRLTPVTAPKDDPSRHYGFSFFTTAGSLSSLRSTDTTSTGQAAPTWVDWTAPDTPQDVRLWVVVRDGRGGAAWLERSVQVH